MSLTPRRLTPLLATACAAIPLTVAPVALADDPMPQVGQSPVEAIADLEDQGYIVGINWTRGYPEVPLSECILVAVHNPDGSGPKTNTTVYLDISCPSHAFD